MHSALTINCVSSKTNSPTAIPYNDSRIPTIFDNNTFCYHVFVTCPFSVGSNSLRFSKNIRLSQSFQVALCEANETKSFLAFFNFPEEQPTSLSFHYLFSTVSGMI